MTKNIAVICDLDVLLVDSEPLHWHAYREVLEPFGLDITQEKFAESWLSGKHYGTTFYLNKVGVTDPAKIAEIREQKSDKFIEIATGVLPLMPGVQEFLDLLEKEGIPCAVGTGGHRKEYDFTKIECNLDRIKTWVGGDEVEHNKPAPDIFLAAAAELGAKPENCVVFENSDIGLSAAINAGMKTIAIPSPYTKKQDFSSADAILSSLKEITLPKLYEICG